MLKVIELLNLDDKFKVVLEVSKKKFGKTFNILDEFILVPLNTGFSKTRVIKRGTKESTLYFLVPKEMRKGFRFPKDKNYKDINIKKIDKKTFIIKLD